MSYIESGLAYNELKGLVKGSQTAQRINKRIEEYLQLINWLAELAIERPEIGRMPSLTLAIRWLLWRIF